MKILIINGPNLNLLGKRNKEVYGNQSFEDFLEGLNKESVAISYKQSNIEGELISFIQDAKVDAIILNAGGYTHTSVALRDCIEAVNTPVVEVHISNLAARESFRHESLISPVCEGCIVGFGLKGYQLAIDYFKNVRE
ncbi:MAG: type II 3-dehydroquinate dehydratase [Lishizhenia sp.]